MKLGGFGPKAKEVVFQSLLAKFDEMYIALKNKEREKHFMTKVEACHKLAEINEAIYDAENDLANLESRLVWDDPNRHDWLLERKDEALVKLEALRREHDEFINMYSDIIYS